KSAAASAGVLHGSTNARQTPHVTAASAHTPVSSCIQRRLALALLTWVLVRGSAVAAAAKSHWLVCFQPFQPHWGQIVLTSGTKTATTKASGLRARSTRRDPHLGQATITQS
ncbi:MAG: hypothetical protein Q7V01_11115, partial [Vicinamibacterales bacterium]|nr:hypothetical protein [Vicinamibacterales bacterium]